MDRMFSLDEARAMMPSILAEAGELIAARADLAELAFDLEHSGGSLLGGLAEIKGIEARMEEILSRWNGQGIEVKGIAPILLDFPASFDGVAVRLCWIEGEPSLTWFHRADLGFPGRRRLT